MMLHRLVRMIAFTAAVILIAAGLLAWLGGTEWLLQRVVTKIVSESEGALSVEGASGSLYGPLRLERIILRRDYQVVELESLAMDWRPWQLLLRRHLDVTALTCNSIRIRQTGTDPEPLTLPETLSLPLTFSVARLEVNELLLETEEGTTPLSGILLSLEKSAPRYRLVLHNLSSPWIHARGRFDLNEAPPFNLEGSFTGDLLARHAINLAATGSLEKVTLDLRVETPQLVTLKTQIEPFAAFPIRSIDLAGSGIDPSQWQEDLPRAELRADCRVLFDGEGHLRGDILLENRIPGRIDHNLLPLKAFVWHVGGRPEDRVDGETRIDLGQAGRFVGFAAIEQSRFHLALHTGNFNPHFVDSRIRSIPLSGDILIAGDKSAQSVKANLAHQRYRLVAVVEHHVDHLMLNSLEIAVAQARLHLTGRAETSGKRLFAVEGRLSRFNPAALGDFPAADLNASLKAAGALAETPTGRLEFEIGRSHIRNIPLSGHGRLHLTPSRISESDIRVKIGDNEIAMQGSFGSQNDRLQWRIDGRNLSVLHPKLGGNILSQGEIRGTFQEPGIDFHLTGRRLQWREAYRVAEIKARGNLAQGPNGPVNLEAFLSHLQTPELDVAQGRVGIAGRRLDHRIELVAAGQGYELHASLSGSFRNDWTGVIQTLDNRGTYPLSLLRPAVLQVGTSHQSLRDAEMDFIGARVKIGEFTYEPGSLVTHGEIQSLAPAPILDIWKPNRQWSTDLVLDGQWDIKATDRLNGKFLLHRRKGDIWIMTTPALDLGLSHLVMEAEATNNLLEARISGEGSNVGSIRFSGSTTLTRRQNTWGILSTAPVSGTGEISLRSIAWAKALLEEPQAMDFDGSFAARVILDGTAGRPILSGHVTGDALRFHWPEEGLKLHDGILRADLEGSRLSIKRMELKSGQGLLRTEGYLGWDGERSDLNLRTEAVRLPILARPDRQLTISGAVLSFFRNGTLRLEGTIRADRALIELPKDDMPARSDDVVVLGREKEEKKAVLPIDIVLEMNLGEQFYLNGQGLDTRLAGMLHLTAAAGDTPQVRGSLRFVRGRYSLYGQRLEIERGILDFQGPPDNPGLDILAMRKNQPVEAGVEMSGTLLQPVTRLVSRPDMPDSEKLSWLILGRGMDNLSGGELDLITIAAGALLSASESVTFQHRLAQVTGLDSIGVRRGETLDATVLALGKRVSSRAYVSYEHGLNGVDNLLRLTYDLTKRLSLQVQTGRENTLDLLYSISFD